MSYDVFHYYNQVREIINNQNENILLDVNVVQDLVSKFDLLINEIQSFLIYSYDYYYGYFLINLKLHYRLEKNFVAGVSLSPGFPVLMINPLTLGKMSLKEIIFVLCHEIEHLVLAHHVEVLRLNKKCDPKMQKKLNLAFDASVNDRLIETINNGMDLIQCPETVVTSKTISSMVNKKILFNQHFLYYYEFLKNQEVEENGSQTNMFDDIVYDVDFGDDSDDTKENSNSNGKEDSDNDDKKDQKAGQGQQNGQDKQNVQVPKYTINNSDNNNNYFDDMGHMLNSGLDEETTEEILKTFVNNALSSMSEKARGLFHANYEELIKKLNKKPIISWKKELKRFLGNTPFGQRKTMMRLNRRQPLRIDLAGKMTDKITKLVLAIDTSGSMSHNELSIVLNEIENIFKSRRVEITIIECDAAIQKVYKVKKIKDISYKVSGRGGTSYTTVIKYINKNRSYRDAILVYFTDGYGEFFIPKPLCYRMLWFVFGNYLSVEEKYGSTIFVNPNNLKVDRREK